MVKELTTKIYENRSNTFDESFGHAMKNLSNLLLREIKIPENPVTLDIGSGTGITSFLLSKQIHNKGTIIGIDIAPSMVEVAKRNASQQGFTNIDFQVGDAERLDFTDSMFDLVICNMTFHHFPDKKKALKEMHRVLKPGGQVALHFNGGPCFKEIVEIGLSVADRHPEYPRFKDGIVEYRDSFLSLEDTVDFMEFSGFTDQMTYNRQVLVFVDPVNIPFIGYSWDYWEPGLPLGVRDVIRSELIDVCASVSMDRGFKFRYSTIISIGKKTYEAM